MPKSQTKNAPLTEEQKMVQNIPKHKPSKKEMDVLNAVYAKFRRSADGRNGNYANFDGLDLLSYINESSRRFITNVDFREDIEDWQARVNDKFTHNKVIAFLSKIVQVLPIAEFTPRGDEDYRKAQILTNLYEYSEDVDDYEELLIHILLECIVKGTAIGYEGHEQSNKALREVHGVGDDITETVTMRRTNRLYGAIVPLEDFYPSNVAIRKIKDMPYCFWRSTYPYQQFLQDFAMFAVSAEVVPFTNATQAETEKRPYYLDFMSQDVGEGQVEVIRYYNRDTDEYVMLANGIWLNPLGKNENQIISPLPFNHKELPFWDVRFEILPNFFYGRSLPDKLKAMQDVLNVLTNMLLDQSFLTIFPPILTAGYDSIEEDYLRPGRRTPIDTQGLPIQDAFMPMDMGTPTGWHQFILDYTRKIMSEASLDQVQSGTAGVGGRTTAQEIRTATEGVSAVLGLFARLVNFGIKRKALLRAKNILQFWTDKNSPIIDQILGDGGSADMKKAFNIVKISNTVLSSGKRGSKIIEMYADKNDMPTRQKTKNRATLAQMETNKKVEIITIPGEYIRGMEFDTTLAVNQKSENTRDMMKALQLEKVRVYMSFFPSIVDQVELAAQTAEVMGDDPTKVLKQDAIQQAMAPAGQQNASPAANSATDNGMSQLPQNAIAPNAVNGMLSSESGGSALQALSQNITG